ncbi:MAG: hypothetical protein AAF542_19345 [Pseudomonadota bacterium]
MSYRKPYPLMKSNRRSFLKQVLVVFSSASLGSGMATAPSNAYARIPFRAPKPKPRAPISYKSRPIPARAPKVRVPKYSTTTHKVAIQRKIDRAKAALNVHGNTARSQLRNALANGGKKYKMGRDWNAHHMIYWRHRDHDTIKKAAKGGYNVNGVENGLRIPKSTHKNIHFADVNNDKAITKLLDDLHSKRSYFTPQQTATVVRNHVRMWKYDAIKQRPLIATFNPEVRAAGSVDKVATNLRHFN